MKQKPNNESRLCFLMVIAVALSIIACVTGCSTRSITYNGATYTSHRLFQNEDVDGLRVTTPDGTIIELTGYRNDQTQAIGAIAEGVAKGILTTQKP